MSWDLERAQATYVGLVSWLENLAGDLVQSLLDKIASWVPSTIVAQYGSDAGVTVQVLRTCRRVMADILKKLQSNPALISAAELEWFQSASQLFRGLVMGLDLQSQDEGLEVGVAPVVIVVAGVSLTVVGVCFAVVVRDVAIVLRDWLAYLNQELAARVEAMRTNKSLPASTVPQSPFGPVEPGVGGLLVGSLVVGGLVWAWGRK